MRELHPTLWRTCRALAGNTRLRLFRLVVDGPGQSVSELADQAGIGCSLASQELRRLQSRGLLQSVRKGLFVQYLPGPDPQVPDARPILSAMKTTFANFTPAADKHIRLIAAALSHPRRIAILKELLNGPRNIHALQTSLRIPLRTLYHHLQTLQDGGMIRTKQMAFRSVRNPHPLATCLADLVRTQAQSNPH